MHAAVDTRGCCNMVLARTADTLVELCKLASRIAAELSAHHRMLCRLVVHTVLRQLRQSSLSAGVHPPLASATDVSCACDAAQASPHPKETQHNAQVSTEWRRHEYRGSISKGPTCVLPRGLLVKFLNTLLCVSKSLTHVPLDIGWITTCGSNCCRAQHVTRNTH
jgi:hypothetical protein